MAGDSEKGNHPPPGPTVNVGQMNGGIVIGAVHGSVHTAGSAPPAPAASSIPVAPPPRLAAPPSPPLAPPSAPAAGATSRAATLVPRVRVGIITALTKELAAMKAMLDEPVEYGVPGPGGGREYWLGEVPGKGGSVHAVAVAASGMGNTQAAARATLLLEHFPQIDALLMVGIAGAVPNPDKPSDHVRLGDIVVSDRLGVVQYDFVKETETAVEHRHSPRPPSARLLEADAALHLQELEGERPWEALFARAAALVRSARPTVPDELRDSADPTRVVAHPADPDRIEGRPRVFRGAIASAHVLLKNPKKRDLLRDTFGVKAVEMEGSGVADATWLHETGYFVVRGTCDYCDGQKSDTWQTHAAVIAAAYARALLGRMRASVETRVTPTVTPGSPGQNAAAHATAAPVVSAAPLAPGAPVTSAPGAGMATSAPVSVTADVVYLSAPADESHRARLAQHLRPGLRRLDLTDWHTGSIPLGTDALSSLMSAVQSARLVLLLVTPDYLDDPGCRAAERAALARIPAGLRVVPVSVRPVADWPAEPFSHLARLPRGDGGNPVTESRSKDQAWADVARDLLALLGPRASR